MDKSSSPGLDFRRNPSPVRPSIIFVAATAIMITAPPGKISIFAAVHAIKTA